MTTTTDQAAAGGLVVYQQSTQVMRDRLAAFVTALWTSLGTYRNDQMAQFTAHVLPVILGAQQQMAAMTAGYLASARTAVHGPALPAAIDPTKVTGSTVRNGTPMDQVYGRPFHLVWRQLGDGATPEQAIQSGLDRAVLTALTDLQLTKTRTAQQVLAKDPHVVGYRRVLEGAYSCGLCVVASTQRYHRGDLMPIHPACDCAVAGIYGDTDPGRVINAPLLDAAHQAIADTFGTAAADAGGYSNLIVTHEHGELGPVLARKGAPFRGPSQIAS